MSGEMRSAYENRARAADSGILEKGKKLSRPRGAERRKEEGMAKDYLNELNAEQREAATILEGPLLIIAGAGTGKTKTLTARTCALIDEGVNPENILLVTFTNKAAGEMKERICRAVGAENGARITACTFHSLCAKLLRINAHLLGYDAGTFSIISDDDAKEILSMLASDKRKELERLGTSAKSFPTAVTLLNVNGESVNHMISVRDAVMRNEKTEGFRRESEEVIKEYSAYKKERNMMDYDDLLLNMDLILRNSAEVRRACAAKYRYVMCDEYQDTNVIQDDILDMLSSGTGNLAVVGDDNQSIYRFRGARIENILSFESRHPGCRRVVLFENYRSTQEILDFCNAVMSHAEEGIRKDLKGMRRGPKPEIILDGSKKEQAENVVASIEERHGQGIPYREMAVMARNSQATAYVESILQKKGIPFAKFGGQKFFSKEIVRNLLAFLRAAVSDRDEIAWYMVLKIFPLIGEERAKAYSAEVASEGAEALLKFERIRFKHYMSMQEAYDSVMRLRTMPLKEQLDDLLGGYYRDVMTRFVNESRMSDENKAEKIDRLDDDLNEAQALYELAEGYASTREFLDDMTLSFANPEKDGDLLNVTTIHSAKGLEYEDVYLLDPAEGTFPRCREGDEDDPEELRCLYVALTRAKTTLKICVAKFGVKYGKPVQNKLSHHLAHDDVVAAAKCPYGIGLMFPDGDSAGRRWKTFRW